MLSLMEMFFLFKIKMKILDYLEKGMYNYNTLTVKCWGEAEN